MGFYTLREKDVEEAIGNYLIGLGVWDRWYDTSLHWPNLKVFWGGDDKKGDNLGMKEESGGMDKFYAVVYASSGSGGWPVPRGIEFCDEASIKRWLKHEYASCPDKLGDDLQRGRLYIYRGRKVTPKIRKVTIDEIDLSW
jgi:hypothetical protein